MSMDIGTDADPERIFGFKLRDALAAIMGQGFLPVKDMVAVYRKRGAGHDVLMLNCASQDFDKGEYLYTVIVGRSFDAIDQVHARWGTQGTRCQIQQFSKRLLGMTGVPGDTPAAWIGTMTAPPNVLASEIAASAPIFGEPFFKRFSDMAVARDALVAEDQWCIGGRIRWANILALDLALGDVNRFRQWSRDFAAPIKQQAESLIEAYENPISRD